MVMMVHLYMYCKFHTNVQILNTGDEIDCQDNEGGQGGLNLPLLVPFNDNPSSNPIIVGSRLFAFFRLQNIAQCCIIFPFFSHFPPPWEPHFIIVIIFSL